MNSAYFLVFGRNGDRPIPTNLKQAFFFLKKTLSMTSFRDFKYQFQKVISFPETKNIFITFLKDEFNEDQFLFFDAFHQYQSSVLNSKNNLSLLAPSIQHILNTFIVEHAPSALNISNELRSNVIADCNKTINTITGDTAISSSSSVDMVDKLYHIFDHIYSNITFLFASDSFSRFLRSTMWIKYISNQPIKTLQSIGDGIQQHLQYSLSLWFNPSITPFDVEFGSFYCEDHPQWDLFIKADKYACYVHKQSNFIMDVSKSHDKTLHNMLAFKLIFDVPTNFKNLVTWNWTKESYLKMSKADVDIMFHTFRNKGANHYASAQIQSIANLHVPFAKLRTLPSISATLYDDEQDCFFQIGRPYIDDHVLMQYKGKPLEQSLNYTCMKFKRVDDSNTRIIMMVCFANMPQLFHKSKLFRKTAFQWVCKQYHHSFNRLKVNPEYLRSNLTDDLHVFRSLKENCEGIKSNEIVEWLNSFNVKQT